MIARRNNSIRGCVIDKRNSLGHPNWTSKKTLAICIKVDNELKKAGHNPAPKFREAIRLNDRKYLANWVLGCHFPWLNPRKKRN